MILFERISDEIHEKLFDRLIDDHADLSRDKNMLLMIVLFILIIVNEIAADELFDFFEADSTFVLLSLSISSCLKAEKKSSVKIDMSSLMKCSSSSDRSKRA